MNKQSTTWLFVLIGVGLVVGACNLAGALFRSPGEEEFNVEVLNDTESEVLVEGRCADCRDRQFTLVPGGEVLPGRSVQLGANANGQDLGYTVMTPAGDLIGCIPLTFDHVEPGLTVRLSQQIRPCGTGHP